MTFINPVSNLNFFLNLPFRTGNPDSGIRFSESGFSEKNMYLELSCHVYFYVDFLLKVCPHRGRPLMPQMTHFVVFALLRASIGSLGSFGHQQTLSLIDSSYLVHDLGNNQLLYTIWKLQKCDAPRLNGNRYILVVEERITMI